MNEPYLTNCINSENLNIISHKCNFSEMHSNEVSQKAQRKLVVLSKMRNANTTTAANYLDFCIMSSPQVP